MSNIKDEIMGWMVILLVCIAFILVSPVITIWSLNTLFHTGIEINWYSYLATLWLTALVAGGKVGSK